MVDWKTRAMELMDQAEDARCFAAGEMAGLLMAASIRLEELPPEIKDSSPKARQLAELEEMTPGLESWVIDWQRFCRLLEERLTAATPDGTRNDMNRDVRRTRVVHGKVGRKKARGYQSISRG
jgi:hypothetical protein